ncbi:MAG: type II toxin-antitoxin system VapC family toxin [Kiritimatiellae bacterium]|nr:type II toxin-antitoxin system VapC family toxin [Kiritimatiellia bacterium]MDD3543833.1 type II toxin-antitoxin system VapC family toxin [Kiritimatiellia bacterium]
MKKVLLDTNAVAAFLKGDLRVLDCVAKADSVYLSAIVLGELLAGFRCGTQFERNQSILDTFMACSTVETLPVTTETSDYYGRLFLALRKKGTPMPVNDLWIAAQAMERGAVLISFDRHFDAVPGLRVG